MTSLHTLPFIILASFLFVACSQETSKKVEDAAGAVAKKSKENLKDTKEQLAVISEKTKGQAAEATQAVKVKSREIADEMSEDLAKARVAAAERINLIVEGTNQKVEELKTKADTKLEGMFDR